MRKSQFLFSILFSTLLLGQAQDTLKVANIELLNIQGKKKLFDRKADRFIYNVQNSMISQGSSGIEVLQSTPLLKIDEEKGSISMIGKSGVSVMVNDRILKMSGSELMEYIKNIRSEDIVKIEVITAPPSKYEAQGNSGLINIFVRKNNQMGWNGNLSTYYKQSTYGSFGGSGGLSFQNEKLNASVKLRSYDDEKKSVENFSVIGFTSDLSRDERRDMNDGFGANVSLDYSLGKNTQIGLIYDLSKSHSNMDIVSSTQYFNGSQNTLNTETNAEHRSNTNSQMLNLYFDQKFGQHRLSFGANYYGHLPKTAVNFTTVNTFNQSAQTVRNLSNVNYNIYSTQGDLTLSFKNIQFETGLKYSQFSNNSDINYFELNNGDYELKPNRSNLFDYAEKNYAAYISTSKDFGEKWSVKFGLRYEYAQSLGTSPTTSLQSESGYGKLFPTAYVSYQLSANHQLSFNYSKRINRPSFRALDPFRWYSNPYSYYSGNPILQPSFNHNVELNYVFKSKFSVNLYYQRNIDGFDQISVLDGINMISTFHNFFNQNSYGMNLNYGNTFFKFWETHLSTSLSYSDTQITKFNAVPQNGSSFYYATNNTFQLNKEKTFFLFANYSQSLPSKDGNNTSLSNANFSTGVKFSLMEKALQINMSVNDLFRQSGYRGKVFFEDNYQTFNNYWDARKVTLSVSYKFGNQKVKAKNRSVDFEEKDRAQ